MLTYVGVSKESVFTRTGGGFAFKRKIKKKYVLYNIGENMNSNYTIFVLLGFSEDC